MVHTAKGAHKIVERCTLPLTATRRVSLIVTEMAVIKPTEKGLVLKERGPGCSVDGHRQGDRRQADHRGRRAGDAAQLTRVLAGRNGAVAAAVCAARTSLQAQLDPRSDAELNRAMPNEDPEWLAWARELQAIAQTGLTFSRDPYDRERYAAMRDLASRMFAARTDAPTERVAALFAGEAGYATPKVDVRAAVFDNEGRILMVRETADEGRWTLPGGWADVNLTAAENAVKEAFEESGFRVTPVKLAAVWDRARQGHAPGVFSCYKLFYICEPSGGAAAISHETSEVGWFAEAKIPADLSLGRVLPRQIRRMFAHRRDLGLPTDYE